MTEKICFDFICDESLIFSHIAEKFRSDGHEVCGFTLGHRWKEAWQGKYDVVALDVGEEDLDWDGELSRIARQYMNHAPAKFCQADRFVSQLNRDLQKKILVTTFIKIEQLVSSGVTTFITTGVAYLYNLVVLAVAEKNMLHALSLYGARQPEARFAVSSGKGGCWDYVTEAYRQSKDANTQEFSKWTEYVDSFREKIKSPDYMKSARQKGGLNWVFINEFLLRLNRWYREGWNLDSDYLTQHPFWYAWRDIKRIINKQFLNLIFSFDTNKANSNYYIYPLHLQPEASTLILGDDYVDQLNTIKSIAKRIPADTLLFVKEHPAAYGRHSLKFYREIQKIYNVRLIDYRDDARKLISDSKGVIVISGTMGWEALLLGVPAFVLGSVFYDGFTGVTKLSSLAEFETLMQSGGGEAPSVRDAAMALYAVHAGSYPGYFDVHKLDTVSKVLHTENLDLIYNGLKQIVPGGK